MTLLHLEDRSAILNISRNNISYKLSDSDQQKVVLVIIFEVVSELKYCPKDTSSHVRYTSVNISETMQDRDSFSA